MSLARFGSTAQLNQRGPRKGLLSFGFRPDRPGGKQILGVDVVTVDGQDLLGETVGGGPMTCGERAQRTIEQFVNAGRLVGSAHRLRVTFIVGTA